MYFLLIIVICTVVNVGVFAADRRAWSFCEEIKESLRAVSDSVSVAMKR